MLPGDPSSVAALKAYNRVVESFRALGFIELAVRISIDRGVFRHEMIVGVHISATHRENRRRKPLVLVDANREDMVLVERDIRLYELACMNANLSIGALINHQLASLIEVTTSRETTSISTLLRVCFAGRPRFSSEKSNPNFSAYLLTVGWLRPVSRAISRALKPTPE